jgi:hypothetical protein
MVASIAGFVSQIKGLLGRVSPAFWKLLLFAVVTRILLTCIGYMAWRLFGQIDPHTYDVQWRFTRDPAALIHPNQFLSTWGHWDSNWYLTIARHWYVFAQSSLAQFRLAFFPLFPFLARCVAFIIGDVFIAGLLVNFAALVTASWFLYKFVSEQWNSDAAFRAARFMLIFPTSFYLSSYLSEPIFLMLSIIAIYYAYKNKWLTASAAAALMIFSRPVGILILVPLVVRYVQTRRIHTTRQQVLTICKLLLIPIAFALYSYVEYLLTGEWFVFKRLEVQGWHRDVTSPVYLLNATLANFVNKCLLFSALFAVVASAYLLRWKRALPLVVWSTVVMVPALVTELPGMPRYGTVVFPMYIALALLTRRRSVDELLTIACSIGLGTLTLLWSINAPFLQ